MHDFSTEVIHPDVNNLHGLLLLDVLAPGLSTSNSNDCNIVTNVEIIKKTVMSTTITTAYHTLV